METIDVPLSELVKLCAVDNDLFGRTFFPRTMRQKSPHFHREMDKLLDNPLIRKANMRVFRGGAKTSRLRLFLAKRVAYSVSRTILYVAASEGHAARTVRWLRNRIEQQMGAEGKVARPLYANTFGLSEGVKWTDTEIEIKQYLPGMREESTVWLLGVGITGSIRGINFEDYRPDLIVLDDIVTDENAATLDQREKITDLVLGAIEGSLISEVEEPNAKIVMLQTPIHPDDVSARAERAASWATASFGCWTPETMDNDIDHQESSWPELYPTETLRQQKRDAIATNSLSKFSREKECRLVSPESCAFLPTWLKFSTDMPKGGMSVLAIDPVPPPSEVQLRKGLHGKDYESQRVWRRVKGDYYCVDWRRSRGHDPNWSLASAFELAIRHRVAYIVVESVAYQKVLKWMLEKEMQRRRMYFAIQEYVDTRSKYARITGTLNGIASHGHLWVHPNDTSFIEQFNFYGSPGLDHDDELDASAIALSSLINPYVEGTEDEMYEDDSDIPALKLVRGCP